MGNQECHEVYRLGRDVGMIPDPQLDRTFTGYLSLNSSTHLSSHYMDVRRSLSPEQLGVFNHGLRATLGESGKVTHGGVGVVALALAFLFDVLAQQAKNQTGSTHFIHRIFREREGDHISEIGTVVSDYLRLVPLIANDPQRMKEETERYEQRLNHSLVGHFERTVKAQKSSWTDWKLFFHGLLFYEHMMIHQVRMRADIPVEPLADWKIGNWDNYAKDNFKNKTIHLFEIINVAQRLMSISPEKQFLFARCQNIEEQLLVFFFSELQYDKFEDVFKAFQKNPSLFLSQNDNFFY